MSEYLTDAERAALAELALLYGTFLTGRWAEVMADDTEPPDDWQEQAALEAVDLFAPGARQVLDASNAETEPPPCDSHREVQHRDRKPPWCNACGWRHGVPAQPPVQLHVTEPTP